MTDKQEKLLVCEDVLDQHINSCVYFERFMGKDNRMEGMYRREGKEFLCHALWDSYLIDWYLRHPEEIQTLPDGLVGGKEKFESFILFLIENGWTNWYKSRREEKLREICSPYFYETFYANRIS